VWNLENSLDDYNKTQTRLTFKTTGGLNFALSPVFEQLDNTSSECSVFTPQMTLAVRTKWLRRIIPLILCIGFHGTGLLARFVT
jgi:hypothetical protein